jgi:hypothetical protein
MANSLPLSTGTSRTSTTAMDSSAYLPLILAVLRISNNQPDALVSFEAVRNVLGNNSAIKQLGWWTYTTLVEEACQRGIIEVIETSGGFKFIRLSSASQKTAIAKTSSAVSRFLSYIRGIFTKVLWRLIDQIGARYDELRAFHSFKANP